jgi:membrane-bound metal-dependent hydrolase YbcI (DUF457 family)
MLNSTAFFFSLFFVFFFIWARTVDVERAPSALGTFFMQSLHVECADVNARTTRR